MADLHDLNIVLMREYLERIRTRVFVVTTLLAPIAFFGLMFLPLLLTLKTRVSPRAAEIQIIDATGSEVGATVAAALAAAAGAARSPHVTNVAPSEVAEAESVAVQRVVSGAIRGYAVLDSSALRSGTVRYAGRNAGSVADVGLLQSAVSRELLRQRLTSSGVVDASAREIAAFRVRVSTTKLTKQGRASETGAAGLWLGLGLGFALYGVIGLYGVAVMRSVTEEKESRTAEIFLSSISPDALIGGKVLGVGLAALTQLVIWAAFGAIFFAARGPLLAQFGVQSDHAVVTRPSIPGTTLLVIVTSLVVGFFLYASIFAAIGSTFNNQGDAQQGQLPALLPLILAITFVQPTVLNPDAWPSRIASWFPLSAPIILPLRVMLGTPSVIEVLLALLGVIATTVLITRLAARVYRVAMLMYGTRPSLAGIVRLARQS